MLAQSPRQLTADDYRQAEKFVGYNTNPLVLNAGVRPNWLPDGRFWYRTLRAVGPEFVLVDPAARTKGPAFDHDRLATALSAAAGRAYERAKLPFLSIEPFHRRPLGDVLGRHASLHLRGGRHLVQGRGASGAADRRAVARRQAGGVHPRLEPVGARRRHQPGNTRSPPTASRTSATPPTTPAGRNSDRPVVLWSPDSKKIATFQQDQRGVGEMYLVDTSVGHPKLQAWKYPLPGDEVITMIQRVVIDVDVAKRHVRFKMPPDQHRSTLCDDVHAAAATGPTCSGRRTARSLAFVSTSRDHKQAELRVADAATGAVRDVLEETVATFFESGNGRVNWRYLPASNEVIWFSRARQLGPALSLRPRDRQAEEPDHQRRLATSRRCCASTRRRA